MIIIKDFLLSKNTKFPFEQFGVQHIIMLIITFFLFILIFIYRKKLYNLKENKFKKLRIFIIVLILLNMFLYRGSYMWYDIYDIKKHLSLYYCHIVNYFFVFSLIINNNYLYKIVYGLAWLGCIWTIFLPEFRGGLDCFIFYSFFISHNLLLVFTLLIMNIKKLRYNFKDAIVSMSVAILMFAVTGLINYDFNTAYNTPVSLIGKYAYFGYFKGYDILIMAGLIGNAFTMFINKLYIKGK